MVGAYLLGLQMAAFLLYPHMVERERSLPLLMKPQSYQRRIPPAFNLNYFLKIISPVIVTLGVRASTREYWEDTIQSIAPEKVWLATERMGAGPVSQ